MKVLCIGEALIDMICLDKGSPLSEGTHFVAKPGGAPTNVAAAVAALGGQVSLVAKVGDDAFGRKLVSTLQQFGVSTRWVIQSPAQFTTLAFVSLMENGERDFIFNRGADGELSPEEVDTIELDQFSIIHFGSATAFLPGPLQSAYRSLLQKAIQKNLFISFDPNYRHLLFKDHTQEFIDQSWDFLSACHFCKLSDEEAMLITNTSTVKEAVDELSKRTGSVFAVTIGKDGAILRVGDTITTVGGVTVNAVDTTGAGDAFVGAVLYQLSKGSIAAVYSLSHEEWTSIISKANKIAARSCEFTGAMEGFRHLDFKNVPGQEI